ncbi:hypothetical protein NDN08_007883 [Rhodosorus marinus]|uniref:Potassium channel domain-containing protein n=1 Tax=Rhodosorus marinus TaxID=101924 RepID=A0AAV8V2X6_9RHOD|nr:hypothetical protein NDN08_007883 [Rhodosorus marinus]
MELLDVDISSDDLPTWRDYLYLLLVGTAVLFARLILSTFIYTARFVASKLKLLGRLHKRQSKRTKSVKAYRSVKQMKENLSMTAKTGHYKFFKFLLPFKSTSKKLTFMVHFVSAVLNFTAIVGWVEGTRVAQTRLVFRILDLIAGTAFFARWLIALLTQPLVAIPRSMASAEFVLDSFSMPSLILSGVGAVSFVNLNYLRAYSFYICLIRLIYGARDPDKGEPVFDISTYVTAWFLQLYMIIFLITASIYSLEVTAALTNTLSILNAEGDVVWNMVTAIYFIFVTASTVGYGDLVPSTVLSQVFLILFLMLLVYLVGGKAASVVEAHNNHQLGDAGYRSGWLGRGHVVVLGNHGASEFQALHDCFFADPSEAETTIVLLGPWLTWKEIHWDRVQSQNKHIVKFVRGSAALEQDLRRSSIRSAGAIFAISNAKGKNSLAFDAAGTLSLLSLRERVPNVPCFATCTLVDSFEHMTESFTKHAQELMYNKDLTAREKRVAVLKRTARRFKTGYIPGVDEEVDVVRSKKANRWGIICTEKSIAALLALNIRFPGAATLVTDIISEFTNTMELEPNKRQEAAKWQKEFGEGRTNSFFLLEVPTWDLQISFASLAAALYDVYGLILVAFLPRDKDQRSKLKEKHMIFADFEAELIAEHLCLVVGTPSRINAAESAESEGLRSKLVELSKSPVALDTIASDAEALTMDRAPPGRVFNNHIVAIIFDTSGVQHLLRCFRELVFEKGIAEETPGVVVVSENALSREQEMLLQRRYYGEVVFIVGQPTQESTFEAAKLQMAKSLLVIGGDEDTPSEASGPTFKASKYDTNDADPVLCVLAAEQFLCGKKHFVYVTTLLKQQDTVGYLENLHRVPMKVRHGDPCTWKSESQQTELLGEAPTFEQPLAEMVGSKLFRDSSTLTDRHQPASLTASGSLIFRSSVSVLLCREYQIPGILDVASMLMSRQHVISLISAPKSVVGRTFSYAFTFLLRCRAIAVGLLRSTSSVQNDINLNSEDDIHNMPMPSSWVYTNPHQETILGEDDGIFIISNKLLETRSILQSLDKQEPSSELLYEGSDDMRS